MTNNQVDINQFIVEMIEASTRGIKRTTEGLPDEQFYYQPTSDTNSIAWLMWHLSRWRDHVSALVSGEPQVWVSEGWAQRYGLPSESTGIGDTPEQVAAFRVMREELFQWKHIGAPEGEVDPHDPVVGCGSGKFQIASVRHC